MRASVVQALLQRGNQAACNTPPTRGVDAKPSRCAAFQSDYSAARRRPLNPSSPPSAAPNSQTAAGNGTIETGVPASTVKLLNTALISPELNAG